MSTKNILFLKLYFFEFPKLITKLKIDLIFNFGDVIIPCNKSQVKQIYFFDWAYAVYDENYIWRNMNLNDYFLRKLKTILIKIYAKNVDLVIVQTNNILNRYKNKLITKKIIKRHTPIDFNFFSNNVDCKFNFPNQKIKFLYPSSFAPHKNFKIFNSLINHIKQKNLNYIFILTLNNNEISELEKLIDKNNFDYIINVGRQDNTYIPSLYKQADAIFLPTLLESYGLPFFEAMHFNKPILTSNLDFAIEICKDYAYYFNPFDTTSILNSMQKFSSDFQKSKFRKKPDLKIENWDDELVFYNKSINSLLK